MIRFVSWTLLKNRNVFLLHQIMSSVVSWLPPGRTEYACFFHEAVNLVSDSYFILSE